MVDVCIIRRLNASGTEATLKKLYIRRLPLFHIVPELRYMVAKHNCQLNYPSLRDILSGMYRPARTIQRLTTRIFYVWSFLNFPITFQCNGYPVLLSLVLFSLICLKFCRNRFIYDAHCSRFNSLIRHRKLYQILTQH
jgi:hypothetical protein